MKTKLLLVLLFLPALCFAQTYTEKTLYYFSHPSTNGTNPSSGLLIDSADNLYGTTLNGGGSVNCTGDEYGGSGCGTIFKLTSAGKESILHTFAGGTGDGANPTAALVMDSKGNLYGAAPYGGLGYSSSGGPGNGIVFKVSSSGKYSILHMFGRIAGDGTNPYGPLTLDSSGNLYGTTCCGGANGYGTIFKVSPSGSETILYSFAGGADGGSPAANLLRDSEGNLYGTAAGYGANDGGVLFELSAQGAESVLYPFCSQSNCYDGAAPNYIARDSEGNFFGNSVAWGIVFEVASDGTETALYSFCLPAGIDCADGGGPLGPLMISGGNIYGTGSEDGETEGVVYELTPSGVETTLYSGEYAKGTYLYGGVTQDKSGNFYGTAAQGGHDDDGTVFKLTKN